MRTIIIGNSGSGKTWLARELATDDARLIHLDDFFWMPGGFDKKRDRDEVNRLISESKQDPIWIAEGVFGELAEQYFDAADTLIFLDIPWDLCRSRLERRGSENKKHHDRDQSEEGLKRLLAWAAQYYDRKDLRSHDGHQSLFARFPGKKLQLKSEEEVTRYLKVAQ